MLMIFNTLPNVLIPFSRNHVPEIMQQDKLSGQRICPQKFMIIGTLFKIGITSQSPKKYWAKIKPKTALF